MSIRRATIGIFALGFAIGVAAAQELEDATHRMAEAVSEATSNSELIETNGFQIESSTGRQLNRELKPTGDPFQMILVRADKTFSVAIESGRPGMSIGGGVGVFDRNTGKPLLSFGDRDGDGRIDILDYNVLDENGEQILSVTDYEFDGQPDLRVHWKEGYFEIRHAGQWYRVTEKNGARGIYLEDEFVVLKNEDNRWIVP